MIVIKPMKRYIAAIGLLLNIAIVLYVLIANNVSATVYVSMAIIFLTGLWFGLWCRYNEDSSVVQR